MPNVSFDGLFVRAATREEASVLSAIAHEAKALWGYDPGWMDSWRLDLTVEPDDVDRMIVLVAESEGELAGFCAADRPGGVWEVAHLWVRPRFGRGGIGRMLLTAIARAAAAAGARRLRVESDPHAEAFYLAAGAVRVGSRPAPMPGAPDRTLPVLELALADDGE